MSEKKINVAVAGLGVIGEGAALRVLEDPAYNLVGLSVRDIAKPRASAFKPIPICDSISALLEFQPDIIVDALPVGDIGEQLIRAALENSISIASANKQAIAGNLSEFHAAAKTSGAQFRYSASVGGGVPMVETIAQSENSSSIVELRAIVNGTVNFILTALGEGQNFDAVIAEAQRLGFAEPDPTADLSGADA